MLEFENKLWQEGYRRVVGIDEAGRGPLAGPVFIAGCILDTKDIPEGINDSKKLSKKVREQLYDQIISSCIEYNIISISPAQIDKINILNAVKLGMRRVAQGIKADFILSDAVNFNCPEVPQLSLIKGDSRSLSIGAASILAKVSRDRYMNKLAKKYPQYAFEKHAGYPTALHRDMIKKHGLSPVHRKTFTCQT